MVCEVSGGFWAWFQQTSKSRLRVWMILFRMFFDFEVKVLKGFKAWFLQSFCTSECFWIFFDVACVLDDLVLFKCLRKASIYRSLRVGKQYVVESDWWHMSQSDWFAYVIAYTRWIAYVIAYICWTAYVIACMRWCVIGFCITLGKFLLVFE